MEIIARIQSDFPTKFAIPRQSGILNELESRIVFEEKYRNPDYIRGIEGFSHLWLIWCFSENADKGSSPTVRPPRLGGNKRVGVFATRSPFRPNPIGLSSVRLLRTEQTANGVCLVVAGADLMDGTPLYDIKPYIPFSDSHPDAVGGFSDDHLTDCLSVVFPDRYLSLLPENKREAALEILRQDPRPSYHDDPDRIYGFSFAGFEIRFKVNSKELTVISLEVT
ncbi:MAG: tRNA (N6-threonylcarbamoyladenosine(37)-N6)-methyltransferase TrmO [Ruminococcaceae bacterium]|nr:tRNA (N6-threonylcarbamoyladenosine(37)-N6)-methyltransferase TrmO [Oscillospiraceae bacterium]